MRSLLDLMPKEEREKAIERGKRRLERKEGRSVSVSPEIYIVAEFGSFYGWEGVLAIKRGYIEIENGGKTVKEPFTLEEAMALLEGAKKVRYAQLVETAHAGLIANTSANSQDPAKAFNTNIKPFSEKAEGISK